MTQNAGNTNTDGFTPQKTRSMGPRPGTTTRGPGRNKPRIHLVSSKGKIPAGVYAEAIAARQKQGKVVPPSTAHLANVDALKFSYKNAAVTSHPQNKQPLPSGVKPHYKEHRPAGGVK